MATVQFTNVRSQPGNLEKLWDNQYHILYNRLTPYAGNSGLLGQEPFIYTKIEDKDNYPNTKYDSFGFPVGSALIDTIRVSKFLLSSRGLLFLAKQAILQTGNTFNETRILNPLEFSLSAARPASLGLLNRQQRNLDISGGLAGIVSSLIGIGSSSTSNPPSGTVDALSSTNKGNSKGLSRAGTANQGLNHLKLIWGDKTAGQGFIRSLFSNFIPQSQSGILAKSGEGSYGLMVADKNNRLQSIDINGVSTSLSQQWIAGTYAGIRKQGEYPNNSSRLFVTTIGAGTSIKLNAIKTTSLTGLSIPNIGNIGYTVGASADPNKPPEYRYSDSIGVNIQTKEEYTNSDIMVQFKDYADPSKNYPSKKTDMDSVGKQNQLMYDIINKLRAASDGSYNVETPLSVTTPDAGYNALFKVKNKNNPSTGKNYAGGILSQYRSSSVSLVSDDIANSPASSKRLPTTNRYDAINTLSIIPASQFGEASTDLGWKTLGWKPYDHDQIAFFFYDVVNKNYIPFRATIEGISESETAEWESTSYIGRADKIYSYTGFTRTLTFNFKIVINSITELAPTWKRINYLSTLVKPSNYTTDATQTSTNISNRFMVPPMIMVTIGDMYTSQPVIITAITPSVPKDAIWETCSENGTDKTWSYLAGKMTATNQNSGLNSEFGQLPREVDISMTMNLLEKEQPVIGGANFGDAQRTNIFNGITADDSNWNVSTPLGKLPSSIGKSLITDVNPNK